jgi:penicillin V acylase-like amidase (Ntn superfamily)
MNNFDIVYGAVKDCQNDIKYVDYTQYTVVYDLTNLEAHYKTFGNPEIRKLSFTHLPLNKVPKKTNKKRNYKKIRKTRRRL